MGFFGRSHQPSRKSPYTKSKSHRSRRHVKHANMYQQNVRVQRVLTPGQEAEIAQLEKIKQEASGVRDGDLSPKELIQHNIDKIKTESDSAKKTRRMNAKTAAEKEEEKARQAAQKEEKARQAAAAASEAARHTIFGRITGLFSQPKGGKTKRTRSNKRMRKIKEKPRDDEIV